MRTPSLFLLPVLLLAMTVLAACGDADGDDSMPSPTEAGSPAAATPTATATRPALPTVTPTAEAAAEPFDGPVARLVVPALDLDVAVAELGMRDDQTNTLASPEFDEVGWYPIYGHPGIDDHAVLTGWWGRGSPGVEAEPGPFHELNWRLMVGDEIEVHMENGPIYTYEVTEVVEDTSLVPFLDGPATVETIALFACPETEIGVICRGVIAERIA